ncbi:hypothetical protein GGI04_004396 [Coemansia thaxteri]|uniref:WLM domain-containing protein n=1 Tax=Coemansia thaxteri TaxID=2663907 RepID=A0A9W8ELM2_9FUNG|nr:hypothetical protein GGI04_004396 [Coemansia thaxteri]KAJ2008375.1 hypothetical protein H4R26_000231 [Coemansia thaxteri]KAJ2469654.1 hypothetical protein GGI02_003338 [Coemansia sp. RSA 2322]KAJ2487611.1 hypothetical protein EV174_000439 [Coemansia sp. RSA 2320]
MCPYEFTVSHRGRAVQVPDMTLGQLRTLLFAEFGVAAAQQRLLLRGPVVGPDDLRLAALVPGGSRVVLMGTPAAALAAHQASAARRSEGQANRSRYQATPAATPSMPLQHTFARLAPLPGLPREPQARALLQRLARDEGVVQVMRKHRYSVRELRELHPREQSILGYNRNRGEVIALRLRTDDLDSFRDYAAIRDVLMHELAHMVWDAHDDNFHRLLRQLHADLDDLDWTRRGQTLSGRLPPPASIDGGALTSTGFVLGGSAPPPDDLESRRDRIFHAYQKRQE